MAWNETAITKDGVDMLNELLAGRVLTISAAYGGTQTVDAATLEDQTDVSGEKHTLSVLGVTNAAEGKTVKVQATNKGVASEYVMKQVAVFAHLNTPEGQTPVDKMLFIMQDSTGALIPSQSDNPMFTLDFYCIVRMSNTVQFQVTVDASGIVTIELMTEAFAAHNADLDAHPGLVGKIKTITGAVVPTGSTVGVIGQHYINTTTGKEYVCYNITGEGAYQWKLAGISDAADITYDGGNLDTFLGELDKAVEDNKTLMGETDPTPSTVGAVGQNYLNTKTGKGFICTAAANGVYTWEASGGKVVYPNIVVNVETGSVVTCTKGDLTLSATAVNGRAAFEVNDYGYWTVKATKDGKASSVEHVAVNQVRQYDVTLLYVKIFGVMWSYENQSTALTRLTPSNDPNGLVNVTITGSPVPAVGTGSGSSPFDAYLPWSGMEEYNIINNEIGPKRGEAGFSRTANDTVVHIPEYYARIVHNADNKTICWYVADGAAEGFAKHPGSGKYLGRYNTGAGHVSKSGLAPLVSITRDAFRVGATSKGVKWSQHDIATWCAYWLLLLVEFSSWDSQAKIGRGVVDTTAAINSGGTDSMVYHTGRAAGEDGKVAVQYRHIENPWGNVWDFLDGINVNEFVPYICLDHTKYADDTASNYTSCGVTLSTTSGYIKGLGVSAVFPWGFFPNAIGGSETTYIPDYLDVAAGWRLCIVGGTGTAPRTPGRGIST